MLSSRFPSAVWKWCVHEGVSTAGERNARRRLTEGAGYLSCFRSVRGPGWAGGIRSLGFVVRFRSAHVAKGSVLANYGQPNFYSSLYNNRPNNTSNETRRRKLTRFHIGFGDWSSLAVFGPILFMISQTNGSLRLTYSLQATMPILDSRGWTSLSRTII